MPYARIAAVTGANKGIGYAIVRNIALSYPKSPLNNGPLLIYLTARNRARGEAARSSLLSDPQLLAAKALKDNGGLVDVKFRELDVSDEASIDDFEGFIKAEHAEGLDVLVNNAGIALDGFESSLVAQTLKCNYHGTLQMTERLLPHMRPHGRIVNMASMIGKLNKYSPQLTSAFRAAATSTSTNAISDLMARFQAAVDAGTYEQEGWPVSAYAVSKAGVVGLSMCLARIERERNPGKGVLVNACCPGYVKSDMTKGRGRKDVDEGARTPVKLAVGTVGDVTGEFWEREEVSKW